MNTVTDYINEVANGLENRDTQRIETASEIAQDWLAMDDEKQALLRLADAAIAAIEDSELEDGEETYEPPTA